MGRSALIGVAIAMLVPTASTAQDVVVRVVDTGPGLCTVTSMPGPHFMVYDAGDWRGPGSRACLEAVTDMIPEGSTIDLMVLSHSDADHLGAVDEILDAYTVERILRPGFQRTTATWRNANGAIEAEAELEDALDLNLRLFEFPPGATYRYGDAFVTFVNGWHEPPDDWDIQGQSELRNAGSIVIRLQYQGGSVLFCGDTVGRHIDGPMNQHFAKVRREDRDPVDRVVGPHHQRREGVHVDQPDPVRLGHGLDDAVERAVPRDRIGRATALVGRCLGGGVRRVARDRGREV